MLNGNEKIEAIAREAKKHNMTYGIFSTSLNERQKENIYRDYEEYLGEKQRKETERLQKNSTSKKQKAKKK